MSLYLLAGDVYLDSILLEAGTDITSVFHISDNMDWWGDWKVTAGSLVLTAVSEPGTGLLLLAALAGGMLVPRRRKTVAYTPQTPIGETSRSHPSNRMT